MATPSTPEERGPLIAGYMYKLSMSGLMKHWNKRYFVLYGHRSPGSLRLEYYDDEINQKIGSGRRVIPLRDCSSCSQVTSMKAHPFVFQATTPLGKHMLSVKDQKELDQWVTGIRTVVKKYMQARFHGKKSRQSSSSSVTSTTSESAKNLPSGVLFRDKVVAVRTNGAQKANLSGTYVLVITSKGIILYCPSTKNKVASWNFKAVKTYGKTHTTFNFETGRNSEFGACRFEFQHKNPKEIFSHVNSSIKSLASSLNHERKSASELRKPPENQQPKRAQSMYNAPIMEEPTQQPESGSRNTSIHLENPLQELKALHESFDNRPISFADSRGQYRQKALGKSEDIFWEEDIDLTDFSDMTDFHNSPPSYVDVLKKDQVGDSGESGKRVTSSNNISRGGETNVFGNDPFSSFAEYSHSFMGNSPNTTSLLTEESDDPLMPPTTLPLDQLERESTPFDDNNPFATSSPISNQQTPDSSNPFDEFGPLQTEESPKGNLWGTQPTGNLWDTEPTPSSPTTGPWDTAGQLHGSTSIDPWSTTESTSSAPTTSPWNNTEPTFGSPSSSPWGNTEPTSSSPTRDPWDTTEPTSSSPTRDPWDTIEPTSSAPTRDPWDTTEPTSSVPTRDPWDTTEPTSSVPTRDPWDTAEPTSSVPTRDPWDTTEPTSSVPTRDPWDTTEPTSSVPTRDPWDTTEPTSSSPTRDPWDTTEPTSTAPATDLWYTGKACSTPQGVNGSTTSSHKIEPQLGQSDEDPWSLSTNLIVDDPRSLPQQDTDNLFRDLDQMTDMLFSQIADFQLSESTH